MPVKDSNRCLYQADFATFIDSDPKLIYATLDDKYNGTEQTTTRDAWKGEIAILQKALLPWKDEDAEIIFEYNIPRLGKRIDVVLLLRGMIFCLEFKVGQASALQADIEQAMDYALDLKNFHEASHDRAIVPILIPTQYPSTTDKFMPSVYDDSIYNPLITGAAGLQDLLRKILLHAQADTPSTIPNWVISRYSPTPTIIEAARALYQHHSVEDITRHEADKVTTDATIAYIQDVISWSKAKGEKSICFVTGVPGAGKTLVGLEVAVRQSYAADGSLSAADAGAVYLSGNGPLVAVLTEALARDNYRKAQDNNEDKNLSDSRREVSKFIQIVHRYRDNMLAKIKNPVVDGRLEIDPEKAVRSDDAGYAEVEHVAIFDEAQRAWTHERIANYLRRGGTYGNKLKVADFPMSEAAFLIWSLDQREDWATIVCLIGGGQEINTGEAGISEWIKAVKERFPQWHVYISDNLTAPEYAEGGMAEMLAQIPHVTTSPKLHLGVSLRSFRAERLSAFVHALLTFDTSAPELYRDVVDHGYPIVVTRSIEKARAWLRERARGTQQTGVLVTKVSARFKPLAVHVLPQGDQNAVHWFLEDKRDVRSSNYLEDAATEIQVQGLELDYACVLWDADMQAATDRWTFWKFNGRTAWTPENNADNRKYMLNAYRVLLTRARQGLVICIPAGNPDDPTRLPSFYDPTHHYLKDQVGLEEI